MTKCNASSPNYCPKNRGTPDQISYLNSDSSTATDSVAIKSTPVLVIRSSGIIMKRHCVTLTPKLLVSLYNLFNDENITLHEGSNPNLTALIKYLMIDSCQSSKQKKFTLYKVMSM